VFKISCRFFFGKEQLLLWEAKWIDLSGLVEPWLIGSINPELNSEYGAA
jgi:hypothetical protein